MANISVYNMEGKEVGTMEISDAIFGVEINEHLVHMAVVQQLARFVDAQANQFPSCGSGWCGKFLLENHSRPI